MHEKNKEKFKDVLAWHDAGYMGEGIVIAVLDEIGVNNKYMEGNYLNPLNVSGQSHASNVAHIIAQIAPKAQIVFLPFLEYRDKEKSIQWIYNNKPHIVNCSFKYTKDAVIKLLEPVKDKSIFVCASGNHRPAKSELDYPAAIKYCISVGSYNRTTGSAISDSNYGPNLTCVSDTFIHVVGSDGKIFAFPGTSAATPCVSGRLALSLEWLVRHRIEIPDSETAKEIVIRNCKKPKLSSKINRIGNGLFLLPESKELEYTFEDKGQKFYSAYLDYRGWLK